MFRLFVILLVGLTTVFLARNSISSVSFEDVVQHRIAMFKSSGANIKKLSKLIRAGDSIQSAELVDFHVKWSEKMLLLFPLGSEASTSNGSDASSDIWRDTEGFEKRVRQYKLSSIKLKEALKTGNITLIDKTFESLVKSCKSCHRLFRN